MRESELRKEVVPGVAVGAAQAGAAGSASPGTARESHRPPPPRGSCSGWRAASVETRIQQTGRRTELPKHTRAPGNHRPCTPGPRYRGLHGDNLKLVEANILEIHVYTYVPAFRGSKLTHSICDGNFGITE